MSSHRNVVNTPDTGRSALLVAAGILLSRAAGLIRDRVFAHYFGNAAAADSLTASIDGGEGTKATSFAFRRMK